MSRFLADPLPSMAIWAAGRIAAILLAEDWRRTRERDGDMTHVGKAGPRWGGVAVLRRRVGQTLVAAAVLAGLMSMPGGGPPRAAAVVTPPNIVFIFADDLDRTVLPHLPNVQRLLVDQGTTFPNFIYNIGLCCPSRATMLRGQYAHNTGVLGNKATDGGFAKVYQNGIERSTIATWLQGGGYATGYVGKYFNGYSQQASLPLTYTPPGWTEWFGNGAGAYDGYFYQVNHNGTVESFGGAPRDYSNDVVADRAVDFVTQHGPGAAPFYLTISPFAPHHPFVPAPRHATLFADVTYPQRPSFNEADVSDKPLKPPLLTADKIRTVDENFRNRLRAAQSVDEMVGRVVALLAAQGELDNTIIAFTSDNGFHMGEHRLAPDVGGKHTPYEEDIRVPLIIRGPGIPAGVTRTELVGNVDVPVSFADAAGVNPPAFVDGRSLLPLARGEQVASWRTSYLLQRGSSAAKPFWGLRTERYTYVEYAAGFRELYDLQADPFQLENIHATAPAALKAALRDRLAQLRTCAGNSCRTVEQAPLG